jgi:hypothetical protein
VRNKNKVFLRFCLHIHLVGGDLADGIEESGDSSGHRFYGVVDLVQSTYFTSLVLEASDQFKSLAAMILALGRWSLGTRHVYEDFSTVINNVRPTPV